MANDKPEFELGTDPEALLVIRKSARIRSPMGIIHDPDPHDERGRATAIGRDGDRDTSSFELRPGRSQSGLELVNRMGDLLTRLHKHYHPNGIAYKAGAYWAPEPLGGHIHWSWQQTGPILGDKYANRLWQVVEAIKGFSAMSDHLIPYLFDAAQVKERANYAMNHRRDFGSSTSTRPTGLEAAMREAHIEYRYPPSWLDCPEAAYCFLGGAEFIVRDVMTAQIGKSRDWKKFVAEMYSDQAIAPPGSPSLAEAFNVAKRFVAQDDFVTNWVA